MAVPVEFVSCAATSAARPKVARRAKKRILIEVLQDGDGVQEEMARGREQNIEVGIMD